MSEPPAPVRARRGTGCTTLALFAGAVLIGIALIEGGVRWLLWRDLALPAFNAGHGLMEPAPYVGWTMAPDRRETLQSLDFKNTVITNSRGLNDGEYSLEKPPGVFRIVILGDSFMFAREVPRPDGLPARLEAALAPRGVEVINLGVPAYGTIQEFLYFRELGQQFEPDLVLLAFYAHNDLRDNSLLLNTHAWGEERPLTWGRPYAEWDAERQALAFQYPDPEAMRISHANYRYQLMLEDMETPVFARTAAGALLRHVIAQRRLLREEGGAVDPLGALGPYIDVREMPPGARAPWERAWTVTTETVRLLDEAARERGAALGVFLIPPRLRVESAFHEAIRQRYPETAFHFAQPHRRMRQFLEENGIPCLDLAPPMIEAAQSRRAPLYFRLRDEHWTSHGHEAAANAVLQWLDAEALVRPPEKISETAATAAP